MVNFKLTAGGGVSVHVDGKDFGYISKERGFFTDPTAVKTLVQVSISDFIDILEKVKEIQGRNF